MGVQKCSSDRSKYLWVLSSSFPFQPNDVVLLKLFIFLTPIHHLIRIYSKKQVGAQLSQSKKKANKKTPHKSMFLLRPSQYDGYICKIIKLEDLCCFSSKVMSGEYVRSISSSLLLNGTDNK